MVHVLRIGETPEVIAARALRRLLVAGDTLSAVARAGVSVDVRAEIEVPGLRVHRHVVGMGGPENARLRAGRRVHRMEGVVDLLAGVAVWLELDLPKMVRGARHH